MAPFGVSLYEGGMRRILYLFFVVLILCFLCLQLPRLYNIYKEMGIVTSFQNILDNIFLPLFEVTVDPDSHPHLHIFLKQVWFTNIWIIFLLFTNETFSAHLRLRTKDFGCQVWARLMMGVLGILDSSYVCMCWDQVGCDPALLYFLFISPFPPFCDVGVTHLHWWM